MNESNFALALDAGRTRVTAATALFEASHGVQVAPFALGSERADVAAVAFITDDGDVLFGEDAAARGIERPERLVREFTRDIGDRIPVVVGGFAIDAAELFARMILWSIGVAWAAIGARPGLVAVTHPTSWEGHRVARIRAALHGQGLDEVLLVPSAVVAAEHSTDVRRGRLVGVFDLGGGTFEASVLRGTEVLGSPSSIDVGGNDLDHSLMRHVLTSIGAERLLESDPGARDAANARRAIVTAKEALSFRADASMPLRLDDRDQDVRLTRFELDDAASELMERTIDTLEVAIESAQVDAMDLDEIVLIGGASRTPLIAQKVSERFDRPITVADDPQFTAVLGAADAAWLRLQKSQPPVVEAPDPAPAAARARIGRRSAARVAGTASTTRTAAILRRLPYGAAAALAAGAVLVAAGVVFGSATPIADSSGSAQDPASAEDSERTGLARLTRTNAGYSTALVETGASETGTGENGAAEPRRGSRDGEVVREPRQRTPQPLETSTPTPNTGTGGGTGSTGAPAPGPSTTAAPADPGTPTTPAAEDPSTPTSQDPDPQPTTPEPDPTNAPDPQATSDPDPAPEPTTDPTPDPGPPDQTPLPASTTPPEEAPPSSADPPPDATAP